ncbi:MAG: PIG-L family deacetylase [Puniceicoccaceae bacterium]|nr:MAG: PIG-L family deacetylase [Puniceicoccaceae bacterium]
MPTPAPTSRPLRILAIGAHPDDCEFKCGGAAVRWVAAGHRVKFVSVTDGRSGHHEHHGQTLVGRRAAEAAAAAAILGVEAEVLGFPDGSLEPSLELRQAILRVERIFAPDLVLTHRPNDYHPDHRYTSQAVQDAAYLVQVPAVAPEAPALRHNPAVAYFSDRFLKPYPFSPDAVVVVDEVLEQKVRAVHCHASQVYEWLPYVAGGDDAVPADEAGRLEWLAARVRARDEAVAQRHRADLIRLLGETRGRAVRCVEVFEFCEYGGVLAPAQIRNLFDDSGAD